MARYVNQPNPYSCGPIAILNALKWAGLDVTLQQLPLLEYRCRIIDPESDDEDDQGTWNHDFDRVLRWAGKKAFKKVLRRKNPSLKEIKEHLKSGGAICLNYYWIDDKLRQEGQHLTFLSGMKRGLIQTINDHDDPEKVQLRTSKTIKKWLSIKEIECPVAWFVTC